MIILDHPQYSDSWYKARAGIPTSSCFDSIVLANGEPSKSQRRYMLQLAGERELGTKADTFQSQAMLRGLELEDEARALYSMIHGVEVQEVGLCVGDEGRWSCSPDGLVGDDGGLEIKCPALHTHVDYRLRKRLPVEYVQQVQGSLFITGRKWWDFISYYPGTRPFIIRVERDEEFIDKLGAELIRFVEQLDEISKQLMEEAA
jgi:predicted phage-related endonuclease